MESVLLDTDVFSFFFKKDTRREMYASDIHGKQLCLSFMTIAELKRWALERNWGERRRESLTQALRHYVVLPYDAGMADAWAEVMVSRSRIGRQIECGDCWIAAAALRHGIPLLTHNWKHFQDIPGLNLVTHAGPESDRAEGEHY
jgi:predicted nucleic acid-binding protein